MSLFYRTFGCPQCEHRWTLCQEKDEAPPKFCPECGLRFAKTLMAIPGTRAIGGSNRAKAVDGTYAALERAGDARMRLAEQHGLPAAQARQLKITDMHDNMREGDVAAVRRPPTVLERQAEQHFNLRPGFWGSGGGFGRISSPISTPQGQFTGPGHIGLHAAQIDHRANLAAVIASGRRAKPGT